MLIFENKILARIYRKKLIIINSIYFMFFAILCYTENCFSEEWHAPESAKELTNPVTNNEGNIAEGKSTYLKVCSMCHGENGAGDGNAATDLPVAPAKLSSNKVQVQTDGELFWKIRAGKNPMPKFESIISEDETWKVIKFIKTFK